MFDITLLMFRLVLKSTGDTTIPKASMSKLDLFKRQPELLNGEEYRIKSDVSQQTFVFFMTRFLGGETTEKVTAENAKQLRDLCDELGFTGFDDELRAVLGTGNPKVQRDVSKEGSVLKDAKGETGTNEPQSGGDGLLMSMLMVNEKDVEINRKDRLAEGCFAEVFKGTYKGREVAVSVVRYEMDEYGYKKRLQGLEIQSRMKHAGTLPLIGFYVTAEQLGATILTPVMSNGTVEDLLKKERRGEPDPRWDATKKSVCVFGVAAAMAYVHSQGILHRDLKPRTVFVNDQLEPVIGGFGLARKFDLEMTMNLGSPVFMAPELWIDDYGDNYTGAVDVYAYAVFLFQMFSDSMTLHDNPRLARSPAQWMMRVGRGARLARPKDVIPDFYWDLITRCWAQNPDDRPTFVDIVGTLQKNRASYAFPGANLSELEEYERRILEGVELVDRTFPGALT